jgi:hypothetical protein
VLTAKDALAAIERLLPFENHAEEKSSEKTRALPLHA